MRMLQSLVRRITRSDDPERGAALPFVAVLLVLLLGVAAFAVDLGWIYLNGARLQRAADSSALAGVVFLPGDIPAVVSSALDGASANGWDVGTVNGAPIAGGGPDEMDWQPLDDNRLEITLGASVPTFFLKVLGFDQFDISRTATAEYVKPVPIGSPFHNFGDGSGNFWAAINGRWTAAIQGDPYNTFCDWATSLGSTGCKDSSSGNRSTYFPSQTALPGDIDPDSDDENPQYHGLGFYYGVEIEDSRDSLTVELYDPRFRRPSGGCSSSGTGDCDRLTFSPLSSSVIGPTTRYQLYAPDSTPLDPRDNSILLCDDSYSPTFSSSASGVNEWVDLCTLNNPAPGIYVLRVSTSDGSGSNQYGVRAITTGPGANSPRVYGIDQISIYTNQGGTTATLYLAEVDPIHAGKVLELKFYDAGEDDQAASYSVKLPDGSTADCEWESEDGESGGPGACTITTTMSNPGPGPSIVGRFNSQWLTAFVEIPDDYSCDIDTQLGCWWSMLIVNSSPHDRTTWTAKIIGNPVHLVPNEP